MKKLTTLLLASSVAAFGMSTIVAAQPSASTAVEPIIVGMNLVDEKGAAKPVGRVTATDTGYGLLLKPALQELPPGLHGFHVHEKPSCEPGEKDGKPTPALGAGGHYDPASTRRHDGPYGTGHLGDLPAIYVNPDGKADYPVLAPRLKVADLLGRSLMIHAGGDNHSDHPEPLGGGGARIACGVVPASAAKP